MSTLRWRKKVIWCIMIMEIVQLKEKIEAIVGPEESAGAEGFEVEVHEQYGTKQSN